MNPVPYLDFNGFEKQELIKKYEYFRINKLFSEVYKIKEKETGNLYIANISRPETPEDKEEAPLKMAKYVFNFDHPSILALIGYSKIKEANETRTVVITEYFSKGILSDMIAAEKSGKAIEGWNNTKKLINIYGIAAGLLYMHKRNFIHRDVKPSKILMDDNFCPKIRGFNLLIKSDDKAREKQVTGTPEYMAPEILMREESTKAMDVYSFAMVVYEIITLRKPFDDMKNPNIIQVLQRVTQGNMPPFDESTPESYRNLISKCWAENPEDRPTFDQIVRSLRTDQGFLMDGVNKEEYLDYIRFLDHYSIIIERRKSAINIAGSASFEEVQILRQQLSMKSAENAKLKEEIEKVKKELADEKEKCSNLFEQIEKLQKVIK